MWDQSTGQTKKSDIQKQATVYYMNDSSRNFVHKYTDRED